MSRLIATTPHMMGRGMHYSGSLVLKVAGVEDAAKAQAAQETLGKVPGVAKVWPFPKQQAVAIAFAKEGDVTSGQLIEALSAAGLEASEFH